MQRRATRSGPGAGQQARDWPGRWSVLHGGDGLLQLPTVNDVQWDGRLPGTRSHRPRRSPRNRPLYSVPRYTLPSTVSFVEQPQLVQCHRPTQPPAPARGQAVSWHGSYYSDSVHHLPSIGMMHCRRASLPPQCFWCILHLPPATPAGFRTTSPLMHRCGSPAYQHAELGPFMSMAGEEGLRPGQAPGARRAHRGGPCCWASWPQIRCQQPPRGQARPQYCSHAGPRSSFCGVCRGAALTRWQSIALLAARTVLAMILLADLLPDRCWKAPPCRCSRGRCICASGMLGLAASVEHATHWHLTRVEQPPSQSWTLLSDKTAEHAHNMQVPGRVPGIEGAHHAQHLDRPQMPPALRPSVWRLQHEAEGIVSQPCIYIYIYQSVRLHCDAAWRTLAVEACQICRKAYFCNIAKMCMHLC